MKQGARITQILEQRQQLATQIKVIKNRLTFGYSEPLHQHYMGLLKQDMDLNCQLTDLLV